MYNYVDQPNVGIAAQVPFQEHRLLDIKDKGLDCQRLSLPTNNCLLGPPCDIRKDTLDNSVCMTS